jgi:hypothetical protein
MAVTVIHSVLYRLLFLFIYISFGSFEESPSIEIEITQIRDWTLCNNGEDPTANPYYNHTCVHHKTQIPCDIRNISNEHCLSMNVKFSLKINPSHFSSMIPTLFQEMDKYRDYRRLVITYPSSYYSNIMEEIDQQLTPRLFLYISYETFPAKLTTSTSTTEKEEEEELLEIIIDRYHHFHEQKLIYLSTIEFPEENTCFKTLFLISRNTCIHPGYASVMGMYFAEHIIEDKITGL